DKYPCCTTSFTTSLPLRVRRVLPQNSAMSPGGVGFRCTAIRWYVLLATLMAGSGSLKAQPGEIFLIDKKTRLIQTPGSIARGAIFTLGLSSSFEGAAIRSNPGFPLQASLDGVRIRVTVRSVTVDAFLIPTPDLFYRHVSAILPSSTPLG